MKTTVIVRRRYKTRIHHNPISGHSWPEDTFLGLWDVDTDLGTHSTHQSEEKAYEEATRLQHLYDKFPV